MEGPLKLPKLNNRGKDESGVLKPRHEPEKKTFRHRAGQLPAYISKDASDKLKEGGTEEAKDSERDHSSEGEVSETVNERRPRKKQSNLTQFLDFESCGAEGLKKRSRENRIKTDTQSDEDIAEELELDDEFCSSMSESDNERSTKLKARQHRSEEQELGESLFDGQEAEPDSSSSEESEEQYTTMSIKPVFKPRTERATQNREETDDSEVKTMEENIKARQEESLRLMKEKLDDIAAKEEQKSIREQMGLTSALGDTFSESGLLDEDEEVDENKEYEEWKQRELGRLVRDYFRCQARIREDQQTEKRRNMTEEERLEDDLRIQAEKAKKVVKQGKMMFMQKYYHSGAFFQNVAGSGEESIFMKDFNAPVPEDAIDKTLLPKAMRVRRGEFGRKGRSKHTHLVDVDTTDWNSPWVANRDRKAGSDSKGPPK